MIRNMEFGNISKTIKKCIMILNDLVVVDFIMNKVKGKVNG